MGKAILVLDDMPNGCYACRLCEAESNGCLVKCKCMASPHQKIIDYILRRPDWCPLKELPESGENCHATDLDIDSLPVEYKLVLKYMAGFDDGWDACLGEICGTEG